MLMVCHHLDPRIPEDVAFAESRIRKETIAAEDILHDLGAFSIISSDSQAMGRVGEVIIRTWQTADKMKRQRGRLPEETRRQRQFPRASATSPSTRSTRRSRTASPQQVGSVEVGKLADLVLWKPAFFGVKPDMVLKGGTIAAAPMGDPNASIPTPQPVHYRPMFGAFGRALHRASRDLRLARRRSTRGLAGTLGVAQASWSRSRTRAAASARRRWSTTTRRRRSRSIPRPTRCAPTASC